MTNNAGVTVVIKRVDDDETDDGSAGQRVKPAETVERLHDRNACDVDKNASRSCSRYRNPSFPKLDIESSVSHTQPAPRPIDLECSASLLSLCREKHILDCLLAMFGQREAQEPTPYAPGPDT
jgi:hypothetical protein